MNHTVLGIPSFSHFRGRERDPWKLLPPVSGGCQSWADWDECQELLESLLPSWQHRLLRLNAFMLTAGPHQSLRQPGFQILGTNRRDSLLLSACFSCIFPVQLCTCERPWQMCKRAGLVGSESGQRWRRGRGYCDAVVWIGPRCCENSSWHPVSHGAQRSRQGWRRASGRALAWRRKATQGSTVLAGCPLLKRNSWRYLLPQGETDGSTQLEFSSVPAIISPSMTSAMWSLHLISCLYFYS